MSWNKSIFDYIYKRHELKGEIYDPWEEIEDSDDWNNYHWLMQTHWDYMDYGAPKSMKELGEYRVVTLLRLLNIKTAAKYHDIKGWY